MKVDIEKIKQFIAENKKQLNEMVDNEVIYTNLYIDDDDREDFNEKELMKVVKNIGIKSLTNRNNLFVAVMSTHLKDIYVKHFLFNLKVVGEQKLEKKFSLYFLEKEDENKIAAIYYNNYYCDEGESYFLIEN